MGTQIHKSPAAGEEGPRDHQTQVLVKGSGGEGSEGEGRGGEAGAPKQKYSWTGRGRKQRKMGNLMKENKCWRGDGWIDKNRRKKMRKIR